MRKPEPQDRPGGGPVPAAISGRSLCRPSSSDGARPAQQQMGGPPQLPAARRPAGPGGPGGPGGPMGGPQAPGGPDGPGGPGGPGRARRPQGGPMADPAVRWAPGGAAADARRRQNNDSAARVLSLAQQTADQAIAEARSEANKIVGEARSRAEGLERDARAKADALERDAQEKHRVAMGSLESARATLERKVEDLRGFEREYRTRLKSYLESQLRQLENQADDSLAPPRTPATASLPPSPSMAPGGCTRRGVRHDGRPPVDGRQRARHGRSPGVAPGRPERMAAAAADVPGHDAADGSGPPAGRPSAGAGAVADAGLPDRRGRQLTD